MRNPRRAFGAAVTATLTLSGLALGAAPTQAAPAAPAAEPIALVRAQAVPGAERPDGLLDPLLLVAQQLPVIGGTAGVGSLLTLSQPVWNLLGVTTSVRWLRDGVAIPGATGWSYLPSVDDAGHTVQAVVTGSLLGLLPLDVVTNALPIPALGGGGGGVGGVGTLLSALQPPSLSGVGSVGSLLTLLDPVWNLPGVSTAYQWFVDGVPVPGQTGPTFVPGLADAGKQVYAVVTGLISGLPLVSTLTDTLSIPALTGSRSVQATSAPSVPGPVKVGTPTTATEPTWDADSTTTTYQWLRDGDPISGAKARTYTPSAVDLGHQLSVLATGSADGYTSSTVESTDPATVQRGDAPRWTVQPRITGTAKRGATLTAQPGSWGAGETPTFTYVWKRAGSVVSGATEATYAPGVADLGRKVTVTVTAVRTGYQPATFTTSPVTVARAVSTTRARLVKARVKPGARAVMAVSLRASGVRPGGTVRVYDGSRRVGTFTITGSRRVRLPVLKAGTHRLRAVYAGSSSVTGSRSGVVRLTVR